MSQMMAGVELMMLGMGIVFVFLIILIFVLRGMSALAARLSVPEHGPEAAAAPSPVAVTDVGAAEPSVVAAISAAITRYRATHRH